MPSRTQLPCAGAQAWIAAQKKKHNPSTWLDQLCLVVSSSAQASSQEGFVVSPMAFVSGAAGKLPPS